MRVRVKICGVRDANIASVVADAGADAMGLVFYRPSPRYVSPAEAAALCAGLTPFLTRVGLFVNAARDEILDVLHAVSLDCLQFHGHEPAEFCSSFGLPYIKGTGVGPDFDLLRLEADHPQAAAFLLDAFDPVQHGGTGRTFDWGRFPKEAGRPLILAGGLTPENVAEALDRTGARAIDVSGGVESSRGIKSANRIHAFIGEVNSR